MTPIEKINELVKEERAEADKLHPLFHSDHEAFGVLFEEIEEVHKEIGSVSHYFSKFTDAMMTDQPTEDHAGCIRNFAIYAIQELIQVVAMAQKAIDSRKEYSNE